uniref:Unc-79-like protein n=1 Tax=Tetranychus evansi TaxID=178897 RepID=A0A3G5ARQ7_9ACAR|nr:unc-79-like protein [Tetranychus evansi]
MATKAATFSAKIKNLQESCNRIINGAFPQPSATDITATLKFFSQILLSVLKDAPSMPIDVICSPEKDHSRTTMFPSLDYRSLYATLIQLLELLPHLQSGIQTVGQTLLHTLSCLVPFLEHEYMDTLPYIVASSMAILPSALHKDLLDMLCYNLLPFTIMNRDGFDSQNFTNLSVSAIMMNVFFYTDSPSFYTQLIETLMKLKKDVVKDLFCVIAHGTVKARCPAVELLFQYWPELNPSPLDRKVLSEKHVIWSPLSCQHENCASSLSNEAVKMCIDHTIAIGSGDRAPPMLICIECADQIYKGRSRSTLVDILLPMEEISYTCVNKACKSSIAQKIAVATCFSPECVNYNCNKPVRYCSLCDSSKHSSPESSDHVVHRTIPSPWKMDSETQSYFIEAIVNLLREAQPVTEKIGKETTTTIQSGNKVSTGVGLGLSNNPGGIPTEESNGNMALEERQLLSRYGVWLITSLCMPIEDTPDDVLGRLLSILFQWFHYTACLPDDQAGSALERLKGECIHGWLMKVVKTHFHVFSNCLLPHPADYAKVGGHWDCWPSQTNQIKEGFKRLLCLVPYDVITPEIWSYIMPYWMECFRHEVPDDELAELKILLSKVLDPDLSPLGLSPNQMYQFISVKFNNTVAQVQEQALYWIQKLTMLEVPVPLKLLLSMFDSGVKSLSNPDRPKVPFSPIYKVSTHPMPNPNERLKETRLGLSGQQSGSVQGQTPTSTIPDESGESSESHPVNDDNLNLTCFILMLDILIKQMELQDTPSHKGLENRDAEPVLILMLDILLAPWPGVHSCDQEDDYRHTNDKEDAQSVQCQYCEMIAIWYQLGLLLMEYFCPVMEATMIDIPFEPNRPVEVLSETKTDVKENESNNLINSENTKTAPTEATSAPSKTATIEVFSDSSGQKLQEIESGSVLISRVIPTATADESCFVSGQYHITSANVMNETDASEREKSTIIDQSSGGCFWFTTQGKFKFKLEELPIQLRLLHILLNKLSTSSDADVLYHIVYILKLMALHSEILNKAAKNHRGFLIWCQENLLIPNLWSLLQAEFSQISQLSVPLLLHCITLPAGRDTFLRLVEEDFHDRDWRKRFTAVERVTTIAHFLESTLVKNSPALQASLTNAICYLVHCLDDIESTVAQRALLNLESIKTASLKLLVWCLEAQFDLVLIDRPIILQTIFQLYNHLSDRRFLTWDFFLNRFDTLFLEAQVNLERLGEISYTRDLKNTNVNSEMYQKKLTRAHEALSQTHVARSLSISFSSKLGSSKRTPPIVDLLAKQVDKNAPRATSAPAVRRKSSRFTGNSAIPDKFRHLPNNFFTDNQLKEIAQEENHIMHVVHKIVELEEQDRDTMHSLIFLLMQFLSRPDHSHPQEEKTMARNQQIVLRHLNILLGFSPSEKQFLVTAANLRNFPVFNAVIASMPKVLDFNFKMGNMLLSTFLPLLIFCPSSQKCVADLMVKPVYSLWLLQPHVRQSWLMSVLIVLYKYTYNTLPVSKHIQALINIVMNTLEAQFHRCRTSRDHFSPVPSRSRDMSATSMEMEDQVEPEMEPLFRSEESSVPIFTTGSSEESIEGDGEGEPELEVILESPKSEEFDDSEAASLSADVVLENGKVSGNDSFTVVQKDDSIAISIVPKDEDKFTEGSMNPPDLGFPANTSDNVLNTPEQQQTQETDMIVLPVERTEIEDEDSVSTTKSRSRPLSPKSDKLTRGFSAEGFSKLKRTDSTYDSETSESKELEITIDADPRHPFSITEKVTREEKRRTKQGIGKILKTFTEESKPPDQPNSEQKTNNKSSEAWKMLDESSGVPILPLKPAPERLLPIGPTVRLPKKPGSPFFNQSNQTSSFSYSPPSSQFAQSSQFSYSVQPSQPILPTQSSSISHVSTSTGRLNQISELPQIQIPPTERLLPIGPNPPFKSPHSGGRRFFSPPRSARVEEKPINNQSNIIPVTDVKPIDVVTIPDSNQNLDSSQPQLPESSPSPALFTLPVKVDSLSETNRYDASIMESDEKSTDLRKVSPKLVKDSSIEINDEPPALKIPRETENIDDKDTKIDFLTKPHATLSNSGMPKSLTIESNRGNENKLTDINVYGKSEKFVRAPHIQSIAKSSLDQSISIDIPENDFIDNNDIPIALPGDQQDNKNTTTSISTLTITSPTTAITTTTSSMTTTITTAASAGEEQKTPRPLFKPKRKRRPTGGQNETRTADLRSNIPIGVAAGVQRRARKIDVSSSTTGLPSKRSSTSQSSLAIPEDTVNERCSSCGAVLEEFSEDEIGMCIVILGSYIHREPAMSAPLLPEMLKLISKFALHVPYPWQHESQNVHLPGCARTIAQQFFRCTLQQLASNGIFQQIFNSHFPDSEFFKAMATSLTDFMDTNQITPLTKLLEGFNEKKHLPAKTQLFHVLSNAAHYMECVPLEMVSQQAWNTFLPIFDSFLRKMESIFPSVSGEVCDLTPVIRMMLITLKLPILNNHRSILEPYSKFVSQAIQRSPLSYQQLLELCHYSGRIFSKDRDRYFITRTIVSELISAIRFKTFVPDENLMMLVQFVLQDLDGTLVYSVVTEHLKPNSDPSIEQYNTNACEFIKPYVNDISEFITDVHTLSRVKSTFLGTCIHLNEETIGGHLKAGLSQILALEITKSNGRDHRAVTRYLPWLYSLPSVQQGPKEFLDCVAHIRILSWILLGSLQHSALMQHHPSYSLSQPIPLEANGHIAEHIQVILAGFAEQSKASVIHMSSLFHAFILCQLWTMYCENISAQNPPGSEQYQQCTLTLSDFWAKITPGILQLVCHSKVDEPPQLAEMVSLHFLSLIEALMECNSNILARLLPMWVPVFRSYEGQLSGHLKVRLQTCINWQPPPQMRQDSITNKSYPSPMLRWLQKLQFKMGQIENQSSTAIQFYCM